MEKRKSYDAVDVAKWICAWLVMYIHLGPVLTGFPVLDKIIRESVCRIAVPFFFAASAFFLFQKLGDHTLYAQENRKNLWNFCRRILVLYTVWVLIYIAYKTVHRHYNEIYLENAVMHYIWGYFFRGAQIHLWYLMATVYAVPIVYLLWRAGKGALIAGCIIGNTLQCLEEPYHFAPVFDLPAIGILRDDFNLIYCALLHGVPMMCLGVLCLMDREKQTAKQWAAGTAVWLVAVIAEVCVLYAVKKGDFVADGLFMTIPVVYCLINWLFTADFRLPRKWMGRALRFSSTWIYCAHWLVMSLWGWVFAYDGVIRFVAVACMTTASSVPYVVIKLLPTFSQKDGCREVVAEQAGETGSVQ